MNETLSFVFGISVRSDCIRRSKELKSSARKRQASQECFLRSSDLGWLTSCKISCIVEEVELDLRDRRRQPLHLSRSSVRLVDRVNRSWNFNYNGDNPSKKWRGDQIRIRIIAKTGRWTMLLLVHHRSWHGISDRSIRGTGCLLCGTWFKVSLVAFTVAWNQVASWFGGTVAYKFPWLK